MSLAENIVEIVRQFLPPGEECPVHSVTVRVGAMAGVVPQSLDFCFGVLTEGTRLAGAKLVVETVPVEVACRDCGAQSMSAPDTYSCPACHGPAITILRGRELQVVSIELGDPVESASPH